MMIKPRVRSCLFVYFETFDVKYTISQAPPFYPAPKSIQYAGRDWLAGCKNSTLHSQNARGSPLRKQGRRTCSVVRRLKAVTYRVW